MVWWRGKRIREDRGERKGGSSTKLHGYTVYTEEIGSDLGRDETSPRDFLRLLSSSAEEGTKQKPCAIVSL